MTDARPRGKRKTWVTGFVAAGLTTGLLAAPPAHSVVGDQVADGTDQFTVKLHIGNAVESDRSCTGTLVDQQWVLTAASCFAADPQQGFKVPAGAPPYTTLVTLDGNRPGAGAVLKQSVKELVPHPDRDLVMARLNDPTTAQNPLDGPFPETSAATVGSTAPAQGDQLRATGFGRTKDEWVPDRAHTGSFGVDTVSPTTLAISPSAVGGGALCKGDAGAPVLNSSRRVVAVVTAAWDGGCFNSEETRTGAVATRVDDIADWVQRVRLKSRQQHITDVMTAADFNDDGRTDIAALMADDLVHVFYGRPDGTLEFGTHASALGRGTHKQLIAGDFTEDKGVEVIGVETDGDLMLAKRRTQLPLPVLWQHEKLWTDATWKNGLPAATLSTGSAGRDTVVIQWPDGSLYTYTRDASGKLVNKKTAVWPDKTWKKRHIATGDFNSDGRDDIAAVGTDGALSLYPGKADGTFDKARSMWHDKTWTTTRPVMGGDFNGDGKADLAAVNSSGDLRWYEGDGTGKLALSRSMWPTV